MERPVPEARSRENIGLRREAGKALSGRVPMLLTVAVAALSGVLVGYGVRGLGEPAGGRGPERRREPVAVRAPCTLHVERPDPALPPPRLQLLLTEPPAAAVRIATGIPNGSEIAAMAKELEHGLCTVVESLWPLVDRDPCGG